MKLVVVVVSVLVFLFVATAQAYRAYVKIPVILAGHIVPFMCSWAAAGIAGTLGVLLLIYGR